MKTEINHAETFRFLKNQGYAVDAIRKVMPILIGIEHGDIAHILGTSRSNVTNHFNMVPYRNTTAIREGIAALLRIPSEEFFADEATQTDAPAASDSDYRQNDQGPQA